MNKARKRRIRELDAEHKAREEAEVLANAERLKSLTAGFSRSPRIAKMARKSYLFEVNSRVEPFLPAKVDPVMRERKAPKLAQSVLDELPQREHAAAEKLKELKTRVGPAFNKGGYQYLGDSDLADVRAGLTRRR